MAVAASSATISAPATSIRLGFSLAEITEANARIEPRVKCIDDDISGDYDHGAEQHGAHDQRNVEIEDRLEGEPSDPGPVEDGFGQHDAGEEPGEVETGECEQRRERVGQGVPDKRAAR